ncbi:hypothetical protein AAG589_16755 [Isoptericola sp. F-RaC21]|uniref:hypothetical protein n=1 Tax=Isoptericola sp. F-RaC21 TaxID=3141452 RepID=UPI00315BEA8E
MPGTSRLDAAALLSGPRGRRLCQELAQAQDDDVRLAVFRAAHDLDPGAGTSRVRYGARRGCRPRRGRRPRPATDDVVRRLGDATFAVPDERQVLDVLGAAVDNARYWQEPDGEDVLAALPEVREALAPAADALLAASAVDWWSTPVPSEAQREVVWYDEGRLGLPGTTTAERPDLVAAWRAETVEDERTAARERPSDPRASWGGAWWSVPPHELLRTSRALGANGPVGLWLVEDGMGWERGSVRPALPDAGVEVLELDGPDDWADLCRRHPLEVTASRRHDWYRTTGRDGAWVLPDWAAVAREVDAVHLTVRGYLTTAGLPVPVSDGVASVLAGWDPDATCWFAGATADPGAARDWRYDDAGGAWRAS